MLSNLLEPELCQFPKGNLLVLIMQLGEREATRSHVIAVTDTPVSLALEI